MVIIQTIEITTYSHNRDLKMITYLPAAVITGIGHLRGIVIVAYSFGRLEPEIHLHVKWRLMLVIIQLLPAA
jgi:hypothetical protein